MKISPKFLSLLGILCACVFVSQSLAAQVPYIQQLAFAGLLSTSAQGQFNGVQSDSNGNLYLLLDQKDGIRLIKSDSTASSIIAEALIGTDGDIGLALALDPGGNLYVTGTTTSGTLAATSGAAFPSPSDTSTNSFVAKFDANLNPIFITYAGSGRMAAASIAATATAVYITGSIFAPTLPVTPFGILQSPATGSTQNGFVEKFNSTGTTLQYATYLTGYGGNTAPSSIAVDPSGNAYVAGFTSASGYPTIAAVVPAIIPATPGATSGFLTRITPNGDGIAFSTFIPGAGITSLAYDPAANELILSGQVSPGQFPIATVSTPLVPTAYQSVLRMSLDGSTVLTSTLLAPGTQSVVTPTPSGSVWVAGTLTSPLLPLPTLSTIGNSYAIRITPQGTIDQAARFGGEAANNPAFASAPVNFTGLTVDASSQPILAGSLNPTTSSNLLASQTFDAPLFNSPTAALPSTIQNAILTPGSCNGSECAGSAAYLAKLRTLAAAPSLAFSIDDSPNIILRNLGSTAAQNLTFNIVGFTQVSSCPTILPAGSDCSIALTGSGPGSISVQATNASTQTAEIPAMTALAAPITFSPRELDFGIQATSSPAVTRVITVTNLTQQSQTFTSALDVGTHAPASPFSEVSSDCATSGAITNKLLAPAGSCHITIALTAITDGPVAANWTIGTRHVVLAGYTQTASLSLSSAEINFGTQFASGLHLPRYLYLSNNSAASITHNAVSLPSSSPFTVADTCPAQLDPQTVCQLQLTYRSAISPSSDATTLNLDQGLTVLVTGNTVLQPGANGSSINPNLSVNPTSLNFPNAVVVTNISSNSQTVTISNTGAQPFTLALSITTNFTFSTNCLATLPGGSNCSVLVTFAPGQPGTQQGLLSIAAGAGTTPAYVALAGVATPVFASANGILDFGSIIVGQPSVQWYKITQPFTRFSATTIGDYTATLIEDLGYGHGQPAASSFSAVASGTCINCWLGVQFLPTATGSRTGSLTLASTTTGSPYSISLTGIGSPLVGLILTPATQDFGTVPVHSTSAAQLFSLTNLTSNALPISVTAPVTTGDFTVAPNTSGGSSCTGTLNQFATCFIQVAFAPTAIAQLTGTLTVQTSAGDVASELNGYGVPDPGLSLDPTSLIFTNIPGILATQQVVTLTNTGVSAIQIAIPTNLSPSFQSSTNCTTLAPASSCTVTVTFIPTSSPITDVLTIPVTGTSGIVNYTVPLNGIYTDQDASLQLIPDQAQYGPTPTSTLGVTRQFTINNLTLKSLALDVALPRDFVLDGSPCTTLAPNASCSFNVAFLPLTNGDLTGTLFAQAIPSDGTATLHAIGYVEGYGSGAATLAITGDLLPGTKASPQLNFGQVVSGQSTAQTLTLMNPSSTPLTIRRVTSQWPFLARSTCGATIASQQDCTVTLTYSPINQVQAGTTATPFDADAGTLTIESDALSSPDVINLIGQSVPIFINSPSNTAPLSSFTASQSSLTFAATPVGDVSLPQTITLSNTGNTAIHITGLQSSSEFATTTACNIIVPGGACPISITFAPQSAGTRISALEISSDSSTALEFISMIGTASPSSLIFNPSSLDFGTVLLGSNATLPIEITNASAAPIIFNSASTSGDYTIAGNCPAAGNPLPLAASCTLQATFAPTQPGTRAGILSLTTSVSALPLTAPLTGIGAQAQLQVTPSSLDFGNVALGASATIDVTLTNPGNASITNLTLTTSGDYTVTTPCANTLAAATTCTATLTFHPSAVGTRSGTLNIANSSTTTPIAVTLTGDGVLGGAFILAVDGGAASSITVVSGKPATYTLTLTPQNNFAGTVVLNCTPINAASNATCSLLPSSILLSGVPQNSIATINTITEVTVTRNHPSRNTPLFFSFLIPALYAIRKRVKPIARLVTIALSCLLAAAALAGCGTVVYSPVRYSPPGAYQYQVTASATTGIPITQSVILNITITSQ